MDDKFTREVAYLNGSIGNCENILFSECGNGKEAVLRPNLSSRRVAKLYGFVQKLLTKYVDQLGVGMSTDDPWYQEEVC